MKSDRQVRVGFLGECMVELKGDPEQSVSLGFSGDSLNTAVYFNRCVEGSGIAAEYLTALGTDPFSQVMLKRWQTEGIGCDFVQQLPDKLPGVYYIHVDERGERSFSYWREQSAAKSFFEVADIDTLSRSIAKLEGLYLSGISLAILSPSSRERVFGLIADIKANGGKIYFDNNYRAKLWPSPEAAREVYTRILEQCDIAFLTLDDESAVFGSNTVEALVERLRPAGIPEVVIKCGAEACAIVVQGQVERVPAMRVEKVVDTTAAGDSFSAAYLAARLCGQSALAAAQAGHRLASTVIQHEGAIIDRQYMPTDIMGRKD